MNQYASGALAHELGLQDIRGCKGLATRTDLHALLHYLWARDTHQFRHERYRVQIAFILHLLSYTATRPGAIIESSAYAQSNEGLLYKVLPVTSLN